jgi:hypothetical protein
MNNYTKIYIKNLPQKKHPFLSAFFLASKQIFGYISIMGNKLKYLAHENEAKIQIPTVSNPDRRGSLSYRRIFRGESQITRACLFFFISTPR